MYFDTHAHYDDVKFDEDRDSLIESLPLKGIALVLNPGCKEESSRMAVGFAEKYPFFYAAVGWHPEEAESWSDSSVGILRGLAANPKVKAIGEIGLDYYWTSDNKELQKKMFVSQMELARELSLPVIIHDREAHADCFEIVREFPDVKTVFHCYSGSAEMARQLIAMGHYLSFTGSITFKNARKAPEVIEAVPMDRIMLETDSPYLAPTPFRGKRNDSTLLPYIAEKIGEIKGLSAEEVALSALENGKRFFGIE